MATKAVVAIVYYSVVVVSGGIVRAAVVQHGHTSAFNAPCSTLLHRAHDVIERRPIVSPRKSSCLRATLPSPEESAKALQDYMTKAHEDKIRALSELEDKYKSRIQELEGEITSLKRRLESPTIGGVLSADGSSYEVPATNKVLAQMVLDYRNFLGKYLIESQIEKVLAVSTAEKTAAAKYEALIEKLKSTKVADGAA